MGLGHKCPVSDRAKLWVQVPHTIPSEKNEREQTFMAEFSSVSAPGSLEMLNEHWYAVYTASRHEKCVAQHLNLRAMETFLPLYERISRWKDRRVRLQLPLFPGYVFVRLMLRDKMRVLEIPGVSRLVGFSGEPVPLPEEDIQLLRKGLGTGLRAEPCPYLKVGERVRVKSGPLRGVEGILKKKKAMFRFIISMELIQRSISVEVDAADLEAPEQQEFVAGAARK